VGQAKDLKATHRTEKPRCIIIARPNGAGKTTLAKPFLVQDAGVVNFINADMIAFGLSPLRPERAARAAGRLLLEEVDRLAKVQESFALESTLSGRSYIQLWKRSSS
jgi:predicted ABC-type ATPase